MEPKQFSITGGPNMLEIANAVMGTGHPVRFTYTDPRKNIEINGDEFHIFSVNSAVNLRALSGGYSRNVFLIKAICYNGNLVSDEKEQVNVEINYFVPDKTGYIKIVD